MRDILKYEDKIMEALRDEREIQWFQERVAEQRDKAAATAAVATGVPKGVLFSLNTGVLVLSRDILDAYLRALHFRLHASSCLTTCRLPTFMCTCSAQLSQ